MKYKKIMIILITAIFLVSIASICAADVNDTMVASEDIGQIELSSDNQITDDNLKTSEENTELTQVNDDETVSAETDSQTLSEGNGTYYNLRDEIGSGGDKTLTKSYYNYTGGDTIEITTPGIINGNGAVIDMAESTIRAFYVSASNVAIRNLTIKNANFNGDGGAIYFAVSGTVENCTFIGNHANGGGVMYEGTAINCRFIENSANSGCGGAINGYNHKSINCTFISNFAKENGGALSGGEAHNCSFISNVASRDGGATNDCKVYNCNFTGNRANGNGGAMYRGTAFLCIFETSSDTLYNTNIPTFTVSKSFFIFDSGDKLLFNLTWDNKNYDGYNTTITLTKDGNPAGVYHALSGSDEGWSADLSPGVYVATLSLGQYAVNPITVEIITEMKDDPTYYGLMSEIGDGGNINLTKSCYNYTGGNTIEIKNSGIINGNGAVIDMAGSTIRAFTVSASNVTFRNLTIKNANFNGDGGAIYFGVPGTVENCTFIGNHANGGGAMCEGYAINCRFIENSANDCGGAINGYNHKSVNCTFIGNTAGSCGGALSGGEAYNCSFISNVASRDGGATNDCKVYNCNFTGNRANGNGGAMYGGAEGFCIFKTSSDTIYNTNIPTFTVSKSFLIFDSGDKLLFNLTWDNKNYDGYNTTINLTKEGNPVGVYYALSGSDEGWYADLSPGVYVATLSLNSGQYAVKPITVDVITGMNVGTYSELSGEIASGGDYINLQYDYYVYDYGSTIQITNPNTVIDGNCAIINMEGSNIQAFMVSASNVTFRNLTIKNANFNGDGGAIYFSQSGCVINCNFADNQAGYGGAIYFNNNGEVINCSFANNMASQRGGAIYFNNDGEVINCSFDNNMASRWGGAIYFSLGSTQTVTNCNFTNNAANYGGAIYFSSSFKGNIIGNYVNNVAMSDGGANYFSYYVRCSITGNYINNIAGGDGGAIYSWDSATVENCNFTDNQATGDGGAVYFKVTGIIINCNFTANNATDGSAIYFYSTSDTKTVSNSIFLNNRANAESLEVFINDNNIIIIFTGNDNLLNAIYSNGDVSFTNVAYWGANGITNTGNSTIKPSRSNKEAGQNITVKGIVNGNIINAIKVTEENGEIVLGDAGDYWVIVGHNGDSYYTDVAETLFTNMKLYANVTSITTTNKTVNITAKSNIYNEVMSSKLLFILPNGDEINATYASNGTWWAVHTFDDYADYQVNASYSGLDNVTINNATISIIRANSTVNLTDVVLNYGDAKNVTVKTEGTTRITAMIDNSPVSVINNYTIVISGLDAGTYTLTVRTIVDDDHNSVDKTVNITVNKANSTLTINDNVTFDYNNNGSTTVSFTNSSGVNASVVGQPNAIVVVNDTIITVSGLAAGNYTLSVTTITDENHNNVTKTANITVNKASTEIILENETMNLEVTDIVSSGAALNPSVAGNLTYTSGNSSVVKIEDGNIIAVGQGQTTVTVSFNGNENCTVAENRTITVTVSLKDASVSVNNSTLDLFVDDTFTIVATTTPAGLNVTFVPDDSGVYTVDENGVVTALKNGTGRILVKVGGDGVYAENSTEILVTVSKIPTNISVAIGALDVKVLDEVGSGATLTPADAGNLTYTSSNSSVVIVENGKIKALAVGNATITVSFAGDNKYAAAENMTINVTVSLNEARVSVNNSTLDLQIDENFTIVATTTPAGLNVTFVPDNSGVYSVDENGFVTALMEGTGSILVKVGGDGVYAENSTNVTVTVSKIPTEIIIANATLDVKVLNFTLAGATLNPADAGNLTYNSSNSSVAMVEYGVIIPVSPGQAIITVSFNDTDKYAAAENKTITVNVDLNNLIVTVDNATLDLKVGETYAINATTVPAIAKMFNITYTSNNESVVIVDKNGTVTAMGEGNAIITVDAGDGRVFAKNSTTVTVTVNKQDANVIVSIPESVTVGQNATVNVKLPSDATGNVTVSVDDTNGTTVSLTNGTANFTLSSLAAGSHSVNITYTGDSKYAPWENKTSFNVNKISTKLTADKVTATYNVNKNLVITLKDANGNALSGVEVTVKIKGSKTYTTDKNGQVKVNVAKLVPKTYTAKISFAGNAKYAASSASVKVTVKKAKAKMVAKKKTFKAKKKVKKYTITLKDNKGKPIKKAKVTLKVKGKTYKAKTNSKGKATFKIKNLKKKGTYKAVIKYKGNKYYKKLTKKVKIKVKKSTFKTLSKGSKDKKTVKRIQQALKDHGYYLTYKGQYLKIDGIYHGHTERSVKEFQKDKGLKVTGKVDEKTAKKLGIL